MIVWLFASMGIGLAAVIIACGITDFLNKLGDAVCGITEAEQGEK